MIQRWLQLNLGRHRERRAAAVALQALWRRFSAKARHATVLTSLRGLSRLLVPVAREFMARRAQVREDAKRARVAEEALAGAIFFKLSRDDEVKRQVLLSTKILDPEIPAETQMIFAHYCAFGQKGNMSRLGVNNWTKLVKESGALLSKGGGLTQQQCELIFTKKLQKLAGGGTESHLHYKEFVSALGVVAEQRFKGEERWGYLRGAPARLVRLLQQFIFKGQTANKVRKKLKSQSAAGRANTVIVNAVLRMQGAYRLHGAQNAVLARREGVNADRQAADEIKAALLFQRFWHRFSAKRRAVAVAKNVYEKYWDSDTGRPYWYNTRSGTAVWTKPSALGADDCSNPVKMPSGPDVFTVTCESCQEKIAMTICLDCDELHCKDCSRVMHGKGRRHGHDIVETEVIFRDACLK